MTSHLTSRLLTDPRYCRDRAEELRSVADQFHDHEHLAALLENADRWDRLAAQAETYGTEIVQ